MDGSNTPTSSRRRGKSGKVPLRGGKRVMPLQVEVLSLKILCATCLAVSLCVVESCAEHGAQAQGKGAESPVEQYLLTTTEREGLIHLDVSVADRNGNLVPGLTANDFTLLDDGQRQELKSFRESGGNNSAQGRLSEIILFLDEVNLPPFQFAEVKREAIRFLRDNNGRLNHPVSVFWFSRTGLRATFQSSLDTSDLATALAHDLPRSRTVWQIPPEDPNSLAAPARFVLWRQSLHALYSIAVEERDKPGRKVLVWMGFGWPATFDRKGEKKRDFYNLVELLTRLREARIALCQIAFGPDPDVQGREYTRDMPAGRSTSDLLNPPWHVVGFDYMLYLGGVPSASQLENAPPYFALPVLVRQSGGLIIDSVGDISRDIARCIRETDLFYTVSFDPPRANRMDEYHSLEVRLKPPGLEARTNLGYYDQPAFYDQPRVPIRRLTVNDLDQMLTTIGEQSDSALAAQLGGLELTERLGSHDLSRFIDHLKGPKSKTALIILADESSFLVAPENDMLNEPAPDRAAQVQMLLRTARYVDELIARLPDFFAKRATHTYGQQSGQGENFWKSEPLDQGLQLISSESATLTFRNGYELQNSVEKRSRHVSNSDYLDFRGVFGPLLGIVLRDSTHTGGRLAWTRWESGEKGRLAVFGYVVSGPHADYAVESCCLRGNKVFRARPGYSGEITIDPETGIILRLTMVSEPGWIAEPDQAPLMPVKKTSMMLEYGPTEIGGKQYMCPLRSVVIMRSRTARVLSLWDEDLEIYTPYETRLNDVTYSQYHKFGSESRMLPGFVAVP